MRTVKYVSSTIEGRHFEDELARIPGREWDWADDLYRVALEAELAKVATESYRLGLKDGQTKASDTY